MALLVPGGRPPQTPPSGGTHPPGPPLAGLRPAEFAAVYGQED